VNAEALRKLFDHVRRGKISPDEAVAQLRHMPFEDIGFAKVDHHRALRVGMPEVIFGEGKTPEPDRLRSLRSWRSGTETCW
jgi:NCAIR mutase (PurE)-related protein